MAYPSDQNEAGSVSVDLKDPVHVASWIEGSLRAIQIDPERALSTMRFAPFVPVPQGPSEGDVALELLTHLDGPKRAAWFSELRRGFARFASTAASGAVAEALLTGIRFISALNPTSAVLAGAEFLGSQAVARYGKEEVRPIVLSVLAACDGSDAHHMRAIETLLRKRSLWDPSFELQKARILIASDPWAADRVLEQQENELKIAFQDNEPRSRIFAQVLHASLRIEQIIWISVHAPYWFHSVASKYWFRGFSEIGDAPIDIVYDHFGDKVVFVDSDTDEEISLADIALCNPSIARLPWDQFQYQLGNLETRFTERFNPLFNETLLERAA